MAAELPVAVKAPWQPPVLQAYDWTGLYVGGHLGYAWGRSTWSAPPDLASSLDLDQSSDIFNGSGSYFGGLQIGYDYMLPNRVVLGVQLDTSFPGFRNVDGISIGGTSIFSTPALGLASYSETVLHSGTVRGRVGYAPANWLFYATGGFAWTYDLGTERGQEATPIVVDGVMYTSGTWGYVYAVDAATGKQLWTFDPEADPRAARNPCCDLINRGVAVWKGKVFVTSVDGHLHAIDAKTGKQVWDADTFINHTESYSSTGAVYMAGDLAVIGNSGSDMDKGGVATAITSPPKSNSTVVKIRTGSVVALPPPMKSAIGTSSSDMTKAKMAPEIMLGRKTGAVTRQNDCRGVAPKFRAASSSA